MSDSFNWVLTDNEEWNPSAIDVGQDLQIVCAANSIVLRNQAFLDCDRISAQRWIKNKASNQL